MSIFEIHENQIDDAFPLLRSLRPHINHEDFVRIYKAAKKADGYAFYGYFADKQCLGLMGLRFLDDFVHGHHLYIDDLVVKEEFRSQRVGAKLLAFAEQLARKNQCSGLRLCTGVENKDGIRFYEREKWAFRAVVYKKKL